MRNLRVRQLLLLLIRTLIVLCLVIAFARPTLQNGAGNLLAERSPIEAVVILDNSLSLNEVRLTGSLLENMRRALVALEPVFQASDRITVLQATHPQDVIAKQESFQSGLWERVLQKLQPNYLKSNLDDALSTAVNQLKNSIYATREIYLISDFQQSAFTESRIQEALASADEDRIKLFTIPISHESAENLSIDSVAVVNRLIEVNQPLQIKAFVRNHHPEKHLNSLTSVLLNGNRVAQQKVSLAPGQLTEVNYRLTLTENGFIRGRVELEGDILQEDNRRYFNFYVPQRIRVLHIYPDAAYNSYFPLIIQPARDQGVFDYEGEILVNWTARNFTEYDMIVLEGLNQLPETLVQRLKNFVEQGGGTLIIPGDQPVIPQYASLFKTFQFGDLLAMSGTPGDKENFLALQHFQWGHPIFEGLFEKEKQAINPIEVYGFYRVKAAAGAENLIQLSDRSPLLLHTIQGKGAAFCLTTGLSPEWSQLPTKGFVVPLLYRLIYFSGTQKIADRQQVLAGNLFQQQFTNLEAPYNFRIASDNDVDSKLTPRFRGSDVFLEFRETELPGNYRILHNERTLSLLSINPWQEESQMTFHDQEKLTELLPEASHFTSTANLAEQIQQSRFGQELWRHFLIAAFILLILEMIIARTGAKQAVSEDMASGMALN